MNQKPYSQRDDNEKTRLACGVPVFTPRGVKLTELQAEAMNTLCKQIEAAVAPVRTVNWNADRDDSKRLHNVVINLSFDNKALERE